MKKFKQNWGIQQNWQLFFPVLGVFILGYCAYKIANLIPLNGSLFYHVIVSILIFCVLLKFTLFLFKKLETKWILDYRWEMIRVFIVFAITGSSSMMIGKPIMATIGITKDNLNSALYWILYIFVGLIFYQILLVAFGWLFGQFKFFWEFEKKMLSRLGFKKFFDK